MSQPINVSILLYVQQRKTQLIASNAEKLVSKTNVPIAIHSKEQSVQHAQQDNKSSMAHV